MLEILLTAVLFGAVVVAAVILLAVRDARLHRIREEQRPLADRIADIRTGARFMTDQLQGVLQRPNYVKRSSAWIEPVIVYYQRLESLAAAPNPAIDEIRRLAEEATTFTRQQRLKGISVGDQAEKLVALVRQRDE
jgi:hypothetical protein